MSRRLVLGAAQFGQRYGVASSSQVSYEEAARIVARSRKEGIDTVDTAAAYADSEEWLGRAGMRGWRVISKIPPIPDACESVSAWVDACLQSSLRRLQVEQLYAVLLHNVYDLFDTRGVELYQALDGAKQRGLLQKVGVSVYDPHHADRAVEDFDIELVQAPFNVFDRRIAQSGTLARLAAKGIEFHARSVFLQGTLLMQDRARPEFLSKWHAHFSLWDQWCKTNVQDPISACLSIPLSFSEVSGILIGVDSERQLAQILMAFNSSKNIPPDYLSSNDLDLVNPARWTRS